MSFYKIKKVTLQDLEENIHLGCLKCKYGKICCYCGLDWTDITKSTVLDLKSKQKKEDPFEQIKKDAFPLL